MRRDRSSARATPLRSVDGGGERLRGRDWRTGSIVEAEAQGDRLVMMRGESAVKQGRDMTGGRKRCRIAGFYLGATMIRGKQQVYRMPRMAECGEEAPAVCGSNAASVQRRYEPC